MALSLDIHAHAQVKILRLVCMNVLLLLPRLLPTIIITALFFLMDIPQAS